jgi:hypothetical protein
MLLEHQQSPESVKAGHNPDRSWYTGRDAVHHTHSSTTAPSFPRGQRNV